MHFSILHYFVKSGLEHTITLIAEKL